MKHNISDDLLEYIPYILEQSKDGIVVSDPNLPDNPVVYVNQIACSKFEYSYEEFIGKNCRFLQGKERDQKALKIVRAAIKKQQSTTVTLRNFTKSGKLIYNQFSISPIFDGKKNLKFFLGVQRDVTKEMLLREQNKQLQEQQIKNAQFNAIGKLSSGLSHEINTPLTIIAGTLEMMRESMEDINLFKSHNYLLEDIENIENQLIRIKNISESIREISENTVMKKENINLYRTVIFALRRMYHKMRNVTKIDLLDEEFDLIIERNKYDFPIYADAVKLEQVWMAIIDNSIDNFNLLGRSKDENLFKIQIEQSEKSVCVIIKDNGGGIDENVLPKIFDSFKGTKEHKGLGIGLSVAKKIIDDHGFEITIFNEDEGAVVKVTVPL